MWAKGSLKKSQKNLSFTLNLYCHLFYIILLFLTTFHIYLINHILKNYYHLTLNFFYLSF